MEGQGAVIGRLAPDFTLPDHLGDQVQLSRVLRQGPALLAFYPGDFTTVCTRQLCNYSDHISAFDDLGIRVLGINKNPVSDHSRFNAKYKFPFSLLSDSGGHVARSFGCTSKLMLGGISRAVFILNPAGLVLYRYVEPTILSMRNASELLGILNDLRANKLL